MELIYEGRMAVDYGQASVEPVGGRYESDMIGAFLGQNNGLLGAGVPGGLFLITGLRTGHVGFRLLLADQAPDLDPDWEDVAEAPFVPVGEGQVARYAVMEWDGDSPLVEFGLPTVPHRVRYSARAMDEGRAAESVFEDEPVVDRYELIFWPAAPTPDEIVRQSSQAAAYWHRAHRAHAARMPTSLLGERFGECESRPGSGSR